jgi:carbamoyltransferase
MVVLGICGPERDAASALVVDGALVAAMTEAACVRMPRAGYAHQGGFPFASVEACLRRAEIAARDVHRVVWCDQDGTTPPGEAGISQMAPLRRWNGGGIIELTDATPMRVGRLHAHASQLRATLASPGPIVILDVEGRGQAAVFERNDHDVAVVRAIDHFSRVVQELNRSAAALGLTGDALTGLEDLASDGQPVYANALGRGLWYEPGAGVEREGRILASVYADADADAGGRLAERAPLHMQGRTTRANLAASVIALIGRIACDIATDVAEAHGVEAIGLGGSLFNHHEVLDRIQTSLGGRAQIAPMPATVGLAIGAAIAGSTEGPVALPFGLSVGAQFTEPDVKAALDGAHLDYVYEPAWDRVHARASRLLARGKLVAWFQGAMDFGTRSLGGRSILCDPSGRYARENVNRYLQQREDDLPPPLVMTADVARECLEQTRCSPFGQSSAIVRAEFRAQLQAGLSASGRCRVQTLPEERPSRIRDLLIVHRTRTRVPALLQVELCGPGEPVACTPRDALRTTYSSPIDALFIERFVLMKDYWLLRSADDEDR